MSHVPAKLSACLLLLSACQQSDAPEEAARAARASSEMLSFTLRTDDGNSAERIRRLAVKMEGYIEEATVTDDGSGVPQASFVVVIPDPQVEAFRRQLAKHGRMAHQHQSIQDEEPRMRSSEQRVELANRKLAEIQNVLAAFEPDVHKRPDKPSSEATTERQRLAAELRGAETELQAAALERDRLREDTSYTKMSIRVDPETNSLARNPGANLGSAFNEGYAAMLSVVIAIFMVAGYVVPTLLLALLGLIAAVLVIRSFLRLAERLSKKRLPTPAQAG